MVELSVVAQGGFRPAFLALIPAFERASGDTVRDARVPSGGEPSPLPARVRAGEALDAVVVAAEVLDALIAEGHVVADSRVPIARSFVGVAVRAGAPRPDISTPEAVTRALIEAPSIVISNGASGAYMRGLFERLGVAALVEAKRVEPPGGPIGVAVARGDAALGFQQISELLPVEGIDLVGPLPDAIQEVIRYAAGVPAAAQHPDAARAFIAHLAAPDAAAAIREAGMEPG